MILPSNRTHRDVAIVVLLSAIIIGGCGPGGTSKDEVDSTNRTGTEANDGPTRASDRANGNDSSDTSAAITIYVVDEEGAQLDCASVRAVTWVPPATRADLPSAAVRRVLQNVRPSANLHAPGTGPLLEYFSGVRVTGDTAIVAFRRGALAYLNSAACAQVATKTPIITTLVALPQISHVVWEIEGEIYTEWDA